MSDGMSRFLVAAVVLAIGAALGYLIRRRRRAAETAVGRSFALPSGLILVTAPYCTRCDSLRTRLTSAGIDYRTVNAADHPSLLADFGLSTAPTLLQVDASGEILDREHHDFSDARLHTLSPARDTTTDKEPR